MGTERQRDTQTDSQGGSQKISMTYRKQASRPTKVSSRQIFVKIKCTFKKLAFSGLIQVDLRFRSLYPFLAVLMAVAFYTISVALNKGMLKYFSLSKHQDLKSTIHRVKIEIVNTANFLQHKILKWISLYCC